MIPLSVQFPARPISGHVPNRQISSLVFNHRMLYNFVGNFGIVSIVQHYNELSTYLSVDVGELHVEALPNYWPPLPGQAGQLAGRFKSGHTELLTDLVTGNELN